VPNGSSAWHYEYSLKDHLGNARVSFRANGSALSVLQENHYYPFGMEMEGAWAAQVGTENAYQYNGKELNEDFGLNLSDYGARWYDAAVGRWWSVDPLAEKYTSMTGYHYALNNPVRFLDMFGMDSSDPNTVRKERQAKAEARMTEMKAEMAAASQIHLPELWVANVAGLSTNKLTNILSNATQIFAKNGFEGVKYNFVSIEIAQQHEETYEKQMFIALINAKPINDRITDPGSSAVQKNGRIGVYDERYSNNFPYNGFKSWVDIGNPVISKHKGDKDYAAGYIVAHEMLHQMAGIAAHYSTGNGGRYNFHRSEGRVRHLNDNGHDTVIPLYSSRSLRPAEQILQFHKDVLNIFNY
jgi:RHS repeat-associated protein